MRVLAALALAALLCGPALAEQRLALVVGNDAYEQVPALAKAVNDADAVGASLGKLGFSVDLVENATRDDFSRKLVEFERKIAPGDVVLFFFAGHGFEIRGDNYLLPIDVPEAREGEDGLVKDASFAAKDIMDRLQEKGAGTLIMVLDACRDNPFARPGQRSLGGATRGLARLDPAEGVFVLMSAGAKQAALDTLGDDDRDPNSIFTRTFLRTLATPGLTLVQIAKQTQSEVKALAATIGHEQTPAYYDQIVGEFFLAGPGCRRAAGEGRVAPPGSVSPADTAPARPAVVRLPRPTSPIEACASAGGSRYCVSSVLPSRLGNTYGPEQLFDGARDTAWVPENLPRSIGQWVTVEFDRERLVTPS